jgi:hypothetical protein
MPRRSELHWSRWRWGGTVLAILALQLALLFLLSDRPQRARPRPPPAGRTLLLVDPATDRWLSQQIWLEDPAQFALVGSRSFSAAAWFGLPRFDPGTRSPTEQSRFLSLDPTQLGLAHESAPPAVLWRAPIALLPPPATFPAPLQTQSVLRVEGALAARSLLTPLALPSWEHTDILQPTTLQVLVDQSGAVFPPILLTASGLPTADQRAIELARSARFAPAQRAAGVPELTGGRLVFLWHAVPSPPSTPTQPGAGRER